MPGGIGVCSKFRCVCEPAQHPTGIVEISMFSIEVGSVACVRTGESCSMLGSDDDDCFVVVRLLSVLAGLRLDSSILSITEDDTDVLLQGNDRSEQSGGRRDSCCSPLPAWWYGDSEHTVEDAGGSVLIRDTVAYNREGDDFIVWTCGVVDAVLVLQMLLLDCSIPPLPPDACESLGLDVVQLQGASTILVLKNTICITFVSEGGACDCGLIWFLKYHGFLGDITRQFRIRSVRRRWG